MLLESITVENLKNQLWEIFYYFHNRATTPNNLGPRFRKPSSLYHDSYIRGLHITSFTARPGLRSSRWTMGGGGREIPIRSGGGITCSVGNAMTGKRLVEGNPQRGQRCQDDKWGCGGWTVEVGEAQQEELWVYLFYWLFLFPSVATTVKNSRSLMRIDK